jgi:hypothetical protein
VVCDPGPSRTADLAEASYKKPGRRNPLAHPSRLEELFGRIGCSAQNWHNRMEKLRDGRLLDRFFATTRAKLREIAERLGMRRPVNVAGHPV